MYQMNDVVLVRCQHLLQLLMCDLWFIELSMSPFFLSLFFHLVSIQGGCASCGAAGKQGVV